MEDLEKLFRESVPKPGCPGWRIDADGREWYSSAWLDRHPEVVELDELPGRPHAGLPACEFTGCPNPAEVYGGYDGGGSWAGWACLEHATNDHSFRIWDRLGEVEPLA